ncbi:ent-kaurenoic acid oxidase 2-like, partial [Carica papaya]|uniref:ent-kaurenoic acid oxidase 2-like n=1 Tax=Carica papaya TaxID=3649 RepID=UPI000B8C7E1B
MEMTMEGYWWWVTWAIGGVPLAIWILWWWNELRYVLPLKLTNSALKHSKLPPGHMGFPFIGEMLSFIWYYKIVSRPDDFIDAKRAKYGDGAGLYRTYLFGFPSILACTPAATKFVFHSHLLFPHRFSTKELVGPNSMLAATGDYHARIKSHVTAGLVHTNSLKKFLLVAQPGMKASLESWAQMGTIRSFDVVKKMVFENIAEFFVSIKPGPLLDELLGYYIDMFKGFKARPLKIPGTTYYHALQCRKKVREIFKIELEKRKRDRKDGEYKDLIDALWQIKDGEGNVLSDEEVLDNISSLILGGYESSSGVAAWAMIYLANNPDVLQKLREENMEISKTLSEGELLTLDHVSKMVYTKKVFEESARLANTTGFLFRAGDQDVEYKGYLIPKGWKVIQWIRYAHESSEYFEDAMTFNPDRWD